MARTFINQSTQIASSETVNDQIQEADLSLPHGLEHDLNAIRSQLNRIIGKRGGWTATPESLAALGVAVTVEAAARAGADSTLTTNLAAEAAARLAADGTIDSTISALDAAYKAADSTLTTAVSDLDAAYKAADTAFAGTISALDTAYKAADSTLTQSLSAEAGTRANADGALLTKLTAETGTRETADTANATAIGAEAAARLAADGTIDSTIGALDAAYKAADSTLTANLATEVTDRKSAYAALGNRIDTETTARDSADATLQTHLNAEAQTRSGADGALGILIGAETLDRENAVVAVKTLITEEANTRGANDVTLQGNVDALAAAVIRKDGTVPFASDQSMGGHFLTNLATPSGASDAANKAYVDSVAHGLTPKDPVVARHDGSLAALEAASGLADGIQLVNGDRVLVVDGVDSGIYVTTVTGKAPATYTFSRALDYLENMISSGTWFFVQRGLTWADCSIVQTVDSGVVGQVALSFAQVSGPGTYTAGNGLSITGTQFSVADGGVYDVMIHAGTIGHDKLAFDAATVKQLDDGLLLKLALAGGTMSGDVAMGGLQSVTGLRAPALAGDAATKQYVDQHGLGSQVFLVVEGGLHATLQAAVDAAAARGTILVGPKSSGLTWGDVVLPTDKSLSISGIGGTQHDKQCRIGAVTFDSVGGKGNVNNNEVCISGLYITASTAGAVVSLGGSAPARLRLVDCYITNTGSGDGVQNANAAANSSLYLSGCIVSAAGTLLKHVNGYTYVTGRSTFDGGVYALSCGGGVVEAYESRFATSTAGPAVDVAGGMVTMGYSTVQNSSTSANAVGVSIAAGAMFGGGDMTIAVGTPAATSGKVVSGSAQGIYAYGSVTYPYSQMVSTVYAQAIARTGGIFTTALAMSNHQITGLAAPTGGGDAANKSFVDAQDLLKLDLAGGTMSGALKMGTNTITGVALCVLPSDAANKKYVDDAGAALTTLISNSIDNLDVRASKTFAVVNADVPANTPVSYANQALDNAFPAMDAGKFGSGCDVYVNGMLQRPGSGFDVTSVAGDLSAVQFSYPLNAGDVISIIQSV